MGVKLNPRVLNPNSCLPHITNTTCKVTIVPKVQSNSFHLF